MLIVATYRSIVARIVLSSLLVCLLSSCAQHVCVVPIPPVEPPATRLKNLHPRVVLVLGSGGARGFAHAGVLKVLQQNHIPIDLIIGTSAGSIVGALYADRPNSDALNKLLLTASQDDVIDFSYLSLYSGPVSGVGLQTFLVKNLRATNFSQLQIPFIAVASDLATGQAHAFASGPIAPAVNASSAAPPYFQPVPLYGKMYTDGGFVDPVAVDIAKRFHSQVIIAVELNYPLSKQLPSHGPGIFFTRI